MQGAKLSTFHASPRFTILGNPLRRHNYNSKFKIQEIYVGRFKTNHKISLEQHFKRVKNAILYFFSLELKVFT
jgi:hypothetical protein